MSLYCIKYQGLHSMCYTYTTKSDINELAKSVNQMVRQRPDDTIIDVRVVKDYDDIGRLVSFFPCEYHTQSFIENYEERLVEQYMIRNLLV